MAEYLWELQIESLPLGWEEEYQKALQLYPYGMILPSDNTQSILEKEHRYFRDPIGYKRRLIELFSQYKQQALELLNDGLHMRYKFDQLLQVDIKLFNAILYWVSPSRSYDPEEFDPNEIEMYIDEPDWYFECGNDSPDYIRTFAPLRVIRISE